MSTPGVKTKLVLYAPRGVGAVEKLKAIRASLNPAEVTDLMPLELEGPSGFTFDYNSKIQLKSQALAFSLFACDGAVHAMNARQALLKGAHGVLLWAESAADVGSLESALTGDFDQTAGKNYALLVLTADAANAKGHPVVAPAAEPGAVLKELMKASLKVVASA